MVIDSKQFLCTTLLVAFSLASLWGLLQSLPATLTPNDAERIVVGDCTSTGTEQGKCCIRAPFTTCEANLGCGQNRVCVVGETIQGVCGDAGCTVQSKQTCVISDLTTTVDRCVIAGSATTGCPMMQNKCVWAYLNYQSQGAPLVHFCGCGSGSNGCSTGQPEHSCP